MSLPEPLTPPDCDCTDLDGFMLNVERLMASELVALHNHEIVAATLFLWCRAWKQLPAASLPDDDRINAAFARMPLARFKKLKNGVLHGFVKCSDGRLYHNYLASEAIKAWDRKIAFRKRREVDAERLRDWRANKPRTQDETRFKHSTNDVRNDDRTLDVREGQGQGQGLLVRVEAALRTAPTKGTRWLSDAVVPDDWQRQAATRRNEQQLVAIDLRLEAEKFCNYWSSKSGRDATKVDWRKTWINWALNAGKSNGHVNGKGRSAHDKFLAAAHEIYLEHGGSGGGEPHEDRGDHGDAGAPRRALLPP